MRRCLELACETPLLARQSKGGGGNQLERFLLKRSIKMAAAAAEADGGGGEVDSDYCRLLGYELLYLWNALGACLKHAQSEIRIGPHLLPRLKHSIISALYSALKLVRICVDIGLFLFLSDCERISVPSLEGVRQLILGSVHSNAGAVVAAKQSYGRAIKHSRHTIH